MFGIGKSAVPAPGGIGRVGTPNAGILDRAKAASSSAPASQVKPSSEDTGDDRVATLEERVGAMVEKLDSILTALEKKSETGDENGETTSAVSELPDKDSAADTETPSSAANALKVASHVATLAELKAALPASTAEQREVLHGLELTVEQAKGVHASMVASATVAGAAATLGKNQPFAVSGTPQGAADETAEQQFASLRAARVAELRAAAPSTPTIDLERQATAEVYTQHPTLIAQMNEERRITSFSKTHGIKPEALISGNAG